MPFDDSAGSPPAFYLSWPPGGVLALDLSSVTGVAYGPMDAKNPTFGTWHLPHIGGEGARYAAFENVLADAMDYLQPRKLVLEAPLPLPAMNNRRSAFQQITLRGISYSEAWRASCAVFEIDAMSVRLGMLGQSRFAKDTVKREVVRFCLRRGLKVPDHNAADSVLLWLWYQAQSQGRLRIAGPLFQETMQ